MCVWIAAHLYVFLANLGYILELYNLLVDVSEEYRKAKIAYLKLELAELELEEEVV